MPVKFIKLQVWHAGYTCNLRISMERADLKTLDAMKARVCTALFDHGLDIGQLEKLRGDNMFYILGVRHTQIYNPNDVPTGATVCFTNVIVDNDPCIYKILVDSYVLPVEVPCRPMKCIEDIEHYVRSRMKKYGATFNNKNHLIVKKPFLDLKKSSSIPKKSQMTPGSKKNGSFLKNSHS